MSDRQSKVLYILVVQEEENGRHDHHGKENLGEVETRVDNALEAKGGADRRLGYPGNASFPGDSRDCQLRRRAG